MHEQPETTADQIMAMRRRLVPPPDREEPPPDREDTVSEVSITTQESQVDCPRSSVVSGSSAPTMTMRAMIAMELAGSGQALDLGVDLGLRYSSMGGELLMVAFVVLLVLAGIRCLPIISGEAIFNGVSYFSSYHCTLRRSFRLFRCFLKFSVPFPS